MLKIWGLILGARNFFGGEGELSQLQIILIFRGWQANEITLILSQFYLNLNVGPRALL